MKELSIEEKAKAYDEALKKARIWKDKSGMPKDKQGILDDIFPELKESEDEKTKKILHSISSKMSFHLRDIFTEEEFQCFDAWSNAWLEKQANHANFRNKIEVGDKVEPKFHEGEWIIFNGLTLFVKEVGNGFYRTYQDNIPDGYYWDIDNVARLWTIQDAKDGDVLALSYASRNYIQIYKRLYEEGFKTIMSVYCFYCVEEDTYYDETDSFHVMNRGEIITPATKEQREQLLKAIADAGYEWDAENRQLKEINFRCTGIGKKEETGALKKMLDLEKGMITPEESLGIDSKTYNKIIDECIYGNEQKLTDEEIKELLRIEYEKGRADAIAEQKPAEWDDEDEDKMQIIINIIKDSDSDWEELINWLKSLKDRVQPKQEWSEEDESLRRRCIGAIDMANLSDYTKDSILNWLKSLKDRVQPQSQWKPSEKQMIAISTAINVLGKGTLNGKYLIELHEQLKKLKE